MIYRIEKERSSEEALSAESGRPLHGGVTCRWQAWTEIAWVQEKLNPRDNPAAPPLGQLCGFCGLFSLTLKGHSSPCSPCLLLLGVLPTVSLSFILFHVDLK